MINVYMWYENPGIRGKGGNTLNTPIVRVEKRKSLTT